MEKWKCTVCGYIHEGPMTPDFKCPVCKQGTDKFVKIEDAVPARNPYPGTAWSRGEDGVFRPELYEED